MATGRFVKTKELLSDADTLVRDIRETGETCYITEDGKATAVLMDINRYNALMDLVEDSETPHAEPAVKPENREHITVRGILQKSKTAILPKKDAK
ncbi:MAG: hypothetical protein WCT04_03215 [Planctomycetota bacterium]